MAWLIHTHKKICLKFFFYSQEIQFSSGFQIVIIFLSIILLWTKDKSIVKSFIIFLLQNNVRLDWSDPINYPKSRPSNDGHVSVIVSQEKCNWKLSVMNKFKESRVFIQNEDLLIATFSASRRLLLNNLKWISDQIWIEMNVLRIFFWYKMSIFVGCCWFVRDFSIKYKGTFIN